MAKATLVLTDVLIDGSTVITDFDSEHQRFRTTITVCGATREIDAWPDETLARSGHSRVLRERTAAMS